MHLSPGMMVTTNVRLTRPLGEGAMGCVWVADHLTLKTEVAVKFISASLALEDPEIVERFTREASIAAQIKSPHVVQTFDQGVMSDGTPYIVMELLEGESLQDLLERQERLGLAPTAQIVLQVARALSKAHELGIVHRDIKPDNIFITYTDDGVFSKILDFGIAKQTQLPKMGGLTNPGVMVGTPEYMSPEQVLSAKDVDFRADIWALAVTAYYCLTGALPFTAEALGTLCVKLLDGKFTPPSELNSTLTSDFDAFFEKALAHAPEERHGGVRELANELLRLVRGVGAGIDDMESLSYVGSSLPGMQPTPSPGAVLQTEPLPAPQEAPTSPLPAQPVPTAPLPAELGGAQPAVTAHDEAARPGTFSGSSSSNRHQPTRSGGWRLAAVIGGAVAVLLVIGGVALLAGDDATKEAPQTGGDEAASTQAADEDDTAPEPPPSAELAPPPDVPDPEPMPTASASTAPAAEPSARPVASSAPELPPPPVTVPQPIPRPLPEPDLYPGLD
jgi:serine/threonine-protein kinase